jgi:hypothetical protein
LNAIKIAAKVLALKVDTLEVRRLNDFEDAFGAAARERAQGVVILSCLAAEPSLPPPQLRSVLRRSRSFEKTRQVAVSCRMGQASPTRTDASGPSPVES